MIILDKIVKILRRDTFFGYKRIDLKVEFRPVSGVDHVTAVSYRVGCNCQ
ncbi:hypothetical protein XBO1_2600002 [Xenorhabdus bovienii str. oregonense]|uniref:Uncharacterized protein n=1 Tax=Xenorhabdus bovienii str. oregonense TaxID=1398202 RepID=A0A077NYK0_XENBV|nr:hypothetical protein XBO1_2600002 [Xenorhabdus bovienii str. oregonense]